MTESTIAVGSPDGVRYGPPDRIARRYVIKKFAALLSLAATGLFFAWYVWPGITSAPTLTWDYVIMLVSVFLGLVALLFLVVVTWNERLARIEDGRLTWPFPFRRESGVRTRYIDLTEIVRAELTVGSGGRKVANLTLRDGTQLSLPQTVAGVDYSVLLQVLTDYVKGRTAQSGNESAQRS